MERLFAFMKKINTLLFLLFLLLVIFGIGKLWWDYKAERRERTFAVTDTGNNAQAIRARLGRVERVEGQSVELVHLLVEGSAERFYSGGRPENMRNILFVSTSGQSHWLLPQHQQRVLDHAQLSLKEQQPTQVLLFNVVSRDSNGDGQLSEEDKQNIVLCQPDGSGMLTALQGIDRLLSSELLSASSLSLLYQQNHALYQAVYSVPGLKLQTQHRLIALPDKL